MFSLTNLVKKYRVTYDSQKDDAFTVNNNKGIVKFSRDKQGLYVFKTKYNIENSNVVTKLEENMVGFTSIQIDRAKLARKIYSNVGLPTVKKFQSNGIHQHDIKLSNISSRYKKCREYIWAINGKYQIEVNKEKIKASNKG